MASSGVLYRLKVLFYVQNNVACITRNSLLATLCGFFTDLEVVEAKNTLFAVATASHAAPESLPRNRTRRGDDRQKSDAGDILKLWEVLDVAKVELPLFVAADQKRIPPITIVDSDLCSMAAATMGRSLSLRRWPWLRRSWSTR